ncbi:conserved protein of unknown function [Candidatus Methylocalor cossyra]|uniref:DUF1840 domain-containing protein n=1 Tax=Candidatus Methylocalor cossyra TaxID=3108543 RepID=A0ABP1C9E1_9GAMM
MPSVLVTFESKVGRVTLFGDVAVQLIRMMGRSGTVPSALLAADIPEALAQLRRALEAADTEAPQDEEDDEDARVTLRTRAFPLLRLLEDSAKHRCDVLWDQAGSGPLRF